MSAARPPSPPHVLRVTVKTLDGAQRELELGENDTIEQVKEKVANTTSLPKEHLRLVFAGVILAQGTVREVKMRDGDFFVAVVARKPLSPDAEAPPPAKAAAAQPMEVEASAQQPKKTDAKDKEMSDAPPPPPPPLPSLPSAGVPSVAASVAELGVHLQDLMNTLVGLAGRPVAAGGQPAAALEPEVDPELVQQLADMGFTPSRARKALLLNRLNFQRATDWLLEHNDDPAIDAPIPKEEPPQDANDDAEFSPNPVVAQRLQEMGFTADDINAALRATNNSYEAACAWLLGDRDGAGAGGEEAEGDEEDMDEDNPLVRAILNNPEIQNSLTPRVIQAFQNMMENPAAAAQYISDPEIAPVLVTVQNIINRQGGGGPGGGPPAPEGGAS